MIQFKSNTEAASVEEIYSEIKKRQIAALMYHDQMANYFDFLSLHGYKRDYMSTSISPNPQSIERYADILSITTENCLQTALTGK